MRADPEGNGGGRGRCRPVVPDKITSLSSRVLQFLLHSYGQFDARHPIHPVVWPHFDLLYVHAGRLELTVGNGAIVGLGAGEGILIYPHTPFCGRATTSRVRASVEHFELENVPVKDNAVWRSFAGRRGGFSIWRGAEAKAGVKDVERALALATLPDDEVTRSMREAQLTLLLGEIRRHMPNVDTPPAAGGEDLRRVMTWARTKHGVVTAAEMAQRAGYSPGHFRRVFQRSFRGRPAVFLLSLRMNEAKRLLRESRKAIKEIGGEVGYTDVVAFHRAFARETGRTPADYRRRFAPRG